VQHLLDTGDLVAALDLLDGRQDRFARNRPADKDNLAVLAGDSVASGDNVKNLKLFLRHREE